MDRMRLIVLGIGVLTMLFYLATKSDEERFFEFNNLKIPHLSGWEGEKVDDYTFILQKRQVHYGVLIFHFKEDEFDMKEKERFLEEFIEIDLPIVFSKLNQSLSFEGYQIKEEGEEIIDGNKVYFWEYKASSKVFGGMNIYLYGVFYTWELEDYSLVVFSVSLKEGWEDSKKEIMMIIHETQLMESFSQSLAKVVHLPKLL